MNYEIIAIIFLIFVYWFFNIKTCNFITIDIPIENMTNIEIFDNF